MTRQISGAAALCLCAGLSFAGKDKVYSRNVELAELELEIRGIHALLIF